ncbi:nodulation protein NfeD [Marinobacteraceae bacterium S3BR75-40.1]
MAGGQGKIKGWCGGLGLWLLILVAWAPAGQAGEVYVLPLQGAVGPAMADFFVRTLEEAEDAQADLLLVTLDTPGGLDTSMRRMIQAILAARIPVAVYVYPQGARAASAGTYLLYSAHIAAMAPATNLGAATPVELGGGGSPLPGGEGDNGESPPKDGLTKMERKQINDAVAYIRGLAELRGRNAAWAEKAVREAASLSADKALQNNVIDVIATDVKDLLAQLDGKTIALGERTVTLDLADASLVEVQPDARQQFLALITDPSVAYILMLIGIYGIIFEFYNPGLGIPGILGAICLLTGLYAMQLLPVNYAGLALIVLGLALMVGEAFVPSFGAMGIGGAVAFVVGSVMLMDTDVPAFQIAWPVIGALAVSSFLMMFMVLKMALRSRRQAVVSGQEALVGAEAIAMQDFETTGHVHVQGEIWKAVSNQPVKKQQRLRVTAVDGLTLHVEAQT